MKRVPVKLGSLDMRRSEIRALDSAEDIQNVDIERLGEPQRRPGFVHRLMHQSSGPIRLLFPFQGICGRFFQILDGGKYISIAGEPLSPWEGTGWQVDLGGPASGGTTYIIAPGVGGDSNEGDPDDEPPEEEPPDVQINLSGAYYTPGYDRLSWTWPDWIPTRVIQGDRPIGGTSNEEMTVPTTQSFLHIIVSSIDYPIGNNQSGLGMSRYSPTIVSVDTDFNRYYTAYLVVNGSMVYGPFNLFIEGETVGAYFTVDAPAIVTRGTTFDLTVTAYKKSGSTWTVFNPTSTVDLNLTGASGASISPTTVPATGWSDGVTTVSCSITGGSGTQTGNIAVTYATMTGSDSLSIQTGYFTLTTQPANDRINPFYITLQAMKADGTVWTDYTPSGAIGLAWTGSDGNDVFLPTSTSASGWSNGAKTVSTCTVSGGSGNDTWSVVATESGITGSGTGVISIFGTCGMHSPAKSATIVWSGTVSGELGGGTHTCVAGSNAFSNITYCDGKNYSSAFQNHNQDGYTWYFYWYELLGYSDRRVLQLCLATVGGHYDLTIATLWKYYGSHMNGVWTVQSYGDGFVGNLSGVTIGALT